MNTLRVGTAELFRIEEMVDRSFAAQDFFPDFDEAAIAADLSWLAPQHYDPATGKLAFSMHAWVVKTGRHTVLVDTCIGNDKERPARPHWHRLATPFLERLRASGTAPEDIDYVMCTHLHPDHVGWNTRLADGRWVPTFPNARYLLGRVEFEFWQANPSPNAVRKAAFDDSVLPIIEAGQAEFVEDGHQIDEVFTVALTPGHTPGHAELRLHSGGQEAHLIGDAIHHPMQILNVGWSTTADTDPALAAVSRRRILERCAERNALLAPAHFMAPHVGRIRPQGDNFTMVWGV